jgi:hypothetical protein
MTLIQGPQLLQHELLSINKCRTLLKGLEPIFPQTLGQENVPLPSRNSCHGHSKALQCNRIGTYGGMPYELIFWAGDFALSNHLVTG